jgi:hypothetical protein
MGLGTASRELVNSKSPPEAFEDAIQALKSIGRISEVDREEFFLRGDLRYGMQKVRLKIFVSYRESGSKVVVKALADDIWGRGAREGSKRFLEALTK